MIFPNEIFVKKIDIKNYREASLPDRPSMFYDRILAQEFKKNFVFIYPEENNSENCNEEEKGKRRILKKGR